MPLVPTWLLICTIFHNIFTILMYPTVKESSEVCYYCRFFRSFSRRNFLYWWLLRILISLVICASIWGWLFNKNEILIIVIFASGHWCIHLKENLALLHGWCSYVKASHVYWRELKLALLITSHIRTSIIHFKQLSI